MPEPSCPQCGSPDELIGRLSLHLEFPLGFGVFGQPELEWTQQSSVTCNACEHSGELYEFFPLPSASPLFGTGGFLAQALGDIPVVNGGTKLDEHTHTDLHEHAGEIATSLGTHEPGYSRRTPEYCEAP